MTDFVTESNGRDCKHGRLARKCEICEMEQEIATLTRERDELRELIVWSVRSAAHIELSSLQSGLDLTGRGWPFRVAVENTPTGIIEALRRAKEGRGDGV